VEILNAQHCLTIAAAFIALVAACASLISVANGKSDTIANRYRELTKEYRYLKATRDRAGHDDGRLEQLQAQIELYKMRVRNVVAAQCFLFRTTGIFVFSIAVFLVLALLIVILDLPDKDVSRYAQVPLVIIGLCVLAGASFMFLAIYRLYLEVKEASETFRIETDDCLQTKVTSLKSGVTEFA
jgi:hypothetical protein